MRTDNKLTRIKAVAAIAVLWTMVAFGQIVIPIDPFSLVPDACEYNEQRDIYNIRMRYKMPYNESIMLKSECGIEFIMRAEGIPSFIIIASVPANVFNKHYPGNIFDLKEALKRYGKVIPNAAHRDLIRRIAIPAMEKSIPIQPTTDTRHQE